MIEEPTLERPLPPSITGFCHPALQFLFDSNLARVRFIWKFEIQDLYIMKQTA